MTLRWCVGPFLRVGVSSRLTDTCYTPPDALKSTRCTAVTWHIVEENWRTDQQKIKLFGECNNGKNSIWLNNVRDWESSKLYMVIAPIALHNWCTQSYIMYQLSTCEMCLKKIIQVWFSNHLRAKRKKMPWDNAGVMTGLTWIMHIPVFFFHLWHNFYCQRTCYDAFRVSTPRGEKD